MFPEPKYAEDIIVGVEFRNIFAWYITDKEYWYLDFTKYDRAFLASRAHTPTLGDYSSRFYIAVLNEESADHFLSSIADRRVPTHALSEMMLVQRQIYEEGDALDSREYSDAILDFVPSLLVDFDQRQLSSQYLEMIRFENYVPDGWRGTSRDFLSDVPEEERYWIVDGHNLFER